MSDNQNLSIWEQVEETSDKYTKVIEAGDMKNSKSVSGAYFFKRATELFGIVGHGWGYDIIEEREDAGVLLGYDAPQGSQEQGAPIYSRVHTIKVNVWYIPPGEEKKPENRCFIGHNFGHTISFYKTSGGYFKYDSEAPKKSLTDALKKSLSMIGIGGDIFLGMHDDHGYVSQLKEKARLEDADDKDAEAIRLRAEFQEMFDREINTMTEAKSEYELKALYSMLRKKLDARKDSPILNIKKLRETLEAHYKETEESINAKKQEGQK